MTVPTAIENEQSVKRQMNRRTEKDMKKKITVLTLCAMLFFLCVAAEAQPPRKLARIGFLGNALSNRDSAITPFRERLRELGYIEGQNIAFERRYWEGKFDRLPDLAAELVHLKCDVIFTTGNEAKRSF